MDTAIGVLFWVLVGVSIIRKILSFFENTKDYSKLVKETYKFCDILKDESREKLEDIILENQHNGEDRMSHDIFNLYLDCQEDITYKINKVNMNRGRATVTLTFKHKDISELIYQSMDIYLQKLAVAYTYGTIDGEKLEDHIIDSSFSPIYEMKRKTVPITELETPATIYLVKSNGRWRVESSDIEVSKIVMANSSKGFERATYKHKDDLGVKEISI